MLYPHWQYLLALDSDLKTVSRYVEIVPENFKTYSIEFVHLLLAAGSEIDVVAKAICKAVAPNEAAEKIDQYRRIITNAYPKFSNLTFSVPGSGIPLAPWKSWETPLPNTPKNPDWWTSYNKVKHYRDVRFGEANLENSINALAGLFAMVLYLYQGGINELMPLPAMLVLDTPYYKPFSVRGTYHLPDFGPGN